MRRDVPARRSPRLPLLLRCHRPRAVGPTRVEDALAVAARKAQAETRRRMITDQIGHTMSDQAEPKDLTFVRTGDCWPYTFWWRDDESVRPAEDKCRCWWDVADEAGEAPATWQEIVKLPEPHLVELIKIQSEESQ
jgi:hypothetical protein